MDGETFEGEKNFLSGFPFLFEYSWPLTNRPHRFWQLENVDWNERDTPFVLLLPVFRFRLIPYLLDWIS